MPYERELEAALEAVERCRTPILDSYAGFEAIRDAAADIKLSVDRDTQEILLGQLGAAFPCDSFCAEEETPTLRRIQSESRSRDRVWIIDPIDGTRGFAMKNGEFSVMVGLVDRGKVVVGVVAEPVRERVTYAAQGAGCWQTNDGKAPTRCRVSSTSDLRGATLIRSRSSGSGRKSPVVEALGEVKLLQVYSAGIKMVLVACGEGDLYVNSYANFHDWDICAGHVLVEEAGGRVTGMKGETLVYGLPGAPQKHGMLASNGVLHDAALEKLRVITL